jgi:hypothetical protein
MELRKEIAELREQLAQCHDAETQRRLRARISAADSKYNHLMERNLRRPQKP